MEKILTLVWKPDGVAVEAFRDQLLAEVGEKLLSRGVRGLRVCISDEDVAAASGYRIVSTSPTAGPPLDALISIWVDSANNHADIVSEIRSVAAKVASYLATESEPIVNTEFRVADGQRTPGMNQVVVLQKPPGMDYATWLDIWLNSHTQIAIDTQATFGYRQNVIVRHLGVDQVNYHAVIEENFPAAAMHSRLAFYAAGDDEQLYKRREKMMLESCMRFIEFEKIDCIPMSEYNLKTLS